MTLGVLTAMFLGASTVYFAESFRATIANVRELGLVTHYSVLAIISFDEGAARLDTGMLIAPVIAAEQAAAVRSPNGLIPAMQNMQDAREV
jgi:hypothetical protein